MNAHLSWSSCASSQVEVCVKSHRVVADGNFSLPFPHIFSSSCADVCSFATQDLSPSVHLSLEAQQNLAGGAWVWVMATGTGDPIFLWGHPSIKYR